MELASLISFPFNLMEFLSDKSTKGVLVFGMYRNFYKFISIVRKKII